MTVGITVPDLIRALEEVKHFQERKAYLESQMAEAKLDQDYRRMRDISLQLRTITDAVQELQNLKITKLTITVTLGDLALVLERKSENAK